MGPISPISIGANSGVSPVRELNSPVSAAPASPANSAGSSAATDALNQLGQALSQMDGMGNDDLLKMLIAQALKIVKSFTFLF